MSIMLRELPSTLDDAPIPSTVLQFVNALGTAAVRFPATNPGRSTGPPNRQSAGVPELYCPGPVRDNPALGEEVNERLIDWAERVGIYPGQLETVRAANFGRLIMLTHPDTDDPDRLLAAAKCALAEWATDDHYCDDEASGAAPVLLSSRLAVANAVVDPAHLPVRYAPRFEQAVKDDPVLISLRESLDHVSQYATPSQLARLRGELANLFVGYSQEASWRMAGIVPPVWEYLVNRKQNSFLPCMALIDVVGGYVLPTIEYALPQARRAITMAAMASVIVNDLYSMAKEGKATGMDFNLPTLIAAEENCSPREAIERSVAIHDELVRTFEAEAAVLSLTGSPALRRFLAGVWAWLGGNLEWHRTSPRYQGASR